MEETTVVFAFDEQVLSQFEQRWQQREATRKLNPWREIVVAEFEGMEENYEKLHALERILELQNEVAKLLHHERLLNVVSTLMSSFCCRTDLGTLARMFSRS